MSTRNNQRRYCSPPATPPAPPPATPAPSAQPTPAPPAPPTPAPHFYTLYPVPRTERNLPPSTFISENL